MTLTALYKFLVSILIIFQIEIEVVCVCVQMINHSMIKILPLH